MTANRSLDEFAGGSSGAGRPRSGADQAGVEDPDVDADEAAPAEEEAPEPIASTYRFSPDGEPCSDCGKRVTERWRQDDGLVCPACKEW